MKISFRQSGGFAGLMRGCDLDTSKLPPADAAQIESLVRQSELPRSLTTRSAEAADATVYDVEVQDRGATYHLSIDDLTMSSAHSQLIELLSSRAGPLAPS